MTHQEELLQEQIKFEIAQRREKLNRELLGKWYPMTYHPRGWCFYACPEIEYTMIAMAYDTLIDSVAYLPVIYNSKKRKVKWCTDNLEPISDRYILIAWSLLPSEDEWVIKKWCETRNQILGL